MMLQRFEHHSEFRRHNASPTKRNSSINVANTFTFIDEPLEDSEVLHVQPDKFDDPDPEDAEDRSSPQVDVYDDQEVGIDPLSVHDPLTSQIADLWNSGNQDLRAIAKACRVHIVTVRRKLRECELN